MIRLAGIEDIPHLLGLMREYYAYEESAFDEGLAASALKGLLSDESLGRVWLVSEGVASIGYAAVTFGYSLEFGGRDALIDELYLKEAWRGRGIEYRLMDAVGWQPGLWGLVRYILRLLAATRGRAGSMSHRGSSEKGLT